MTAIDGSQDHTFSNDAGVHLRPEDTGLLSIDLGAIGQNYRALKSVTDNAECAAVVKADAYGLGAAQIVPALIHEGCKTFFVATVQEAFQLRAIAGSARIFVLNGLSRGAAPAIAQIKACPVLSSLTEIEEWAAFCAASQKQLPAAIHIDTGMNRLGLSQDEVETLARRPELLNCFDLCHIMSHLACADRPSAPKNTEQLNRFLSLKSMLPSCPVSIANSGGVILGRPFHLDMVRPGIAIYGGRAISEGVNPMKPVVRLFARVLQLRDVDQGQSVSYGGERILSRPSKVATLALGYADGFFRELGRSDSKPAANVFFGQYPAPVLGRVSMDLICVDVTDISSDYVARGTLAEIIGPHMEIDEIAARAGTISYEILTALGQRYRRKYIGRPSLSSSPTS